MSWVYVNTVPTLTSFLFLVDLIASFLVLVLMNSSLLINKDEKIYMWCNWCLLPTLERKVLVTKVSMMVAVTTVVVLSGDDSSGGDVVLVVIKKTFSTFKKRKCFAHELTHFPLTH